MPAAHAETESRLAGRRVVWLAAPAMVVVAGLFYWFALHGKLLRPYHDSWKRGDMSDWTVYGGTWAVNDGVLENLSAARGDKAVTGNSRWTDYVIETDVRLNLDPADSLWGDAGVVLRVTDPSVGVDSYDGYYVGIGSEGSVLLLGRANYSWARLATVPLGVAAKRGAWFHLRAMVKGCYFEANAEDLATRTQSRLTYFDRDCTKRAGAVGVRTFGLPASWRNFSVRQPD